MISVHEFPRGFLWGISMAAFQYEMGVSKEAIDPNSDWYVWLHDKTNIEKGIVSGDVPENGPGYWDLFRKDHQLAQWLGLNAWRMNPEWSRIFPKSTKEVKVTVHKDDEGIKDIDISEDALRKLDELANKSAVEHYREVFMDIKGRGMKLIINLYHWPLPLWLHDPIRVRDTNLREGPRGWYDEDAIIEFAKFAAYIAWKFGDLADMWSTFNEPSVTWTLGYIGGNFPPGITNYEAIPRIMINIAQAHARAYDQIKRITGKDVKVGIIYATSPAEPVDEKEENVKAAERANYLANLWLFRAIVEGELDVTPYAIEPKVVKRDDLRDRVDWIGVNYYTRQVVQHQEAPPGFKVVENYGFACKPNSTSAAGRPTSDFGWELYPEGIVSALKLFAKYGRPMAITENGIADAVDRHRPWLLVATLRYLHKAVKEGLNVFGYFHWSLIDNLEWAAGFRMRFGLFYVNMRTKERVPRPSAFIYKHIIEENGIPEYLEEYARIPNFMLGKVE
ncbi:MAG: glycoside hydrolase family 1 protein [Thermoprotei archaeon]|nr:MAG: glycoside hydrolase family 1 protein [Thermoprotei archaeon]RLF25429.1 MAG: glycoside hydrolase family 1 protein [Thermoprotei archaeon]